MSCSQPAASILIVEPNRSAAQRLRAALREGGYEILWARDAEEGQDLARCDLPDLSLVDAALFESRASPSVGDNGGCAQEIPVILMTASGDSQALLRGLRSGAVDCIGKPCDPAELLARVDLRLYQERCWREARDQELAKLHQLRAAQLAMLPLPREVPGGNFGVGYFPVLEAGGDHYDVFPVAAGVTGYLVADISGHDLGAAYVGPALKVILRQAAQPGTAPVQVLREVNRALLHVLREGLHVTACYLQLDRGNGRCELVGAGHTPVVHLEAGGRAALWGAEGDVLGAFHQVEFGRHEFPVDQGDRLFLYTDGLVEALGGRRRDRRAGVAALVGACRDAATLPIEYAVPEILVQALGGNRALEDDVLLLGTEV